VKKLLLTILAFSYLLVSSGVGMNTHFCMGKISSVDLFDHGNEKCGKCGMTSSDNGGCCKDEYKIVKLQDSHNLADAAFKIFQFTSVPAVPFSHLVLVFNKEPKVARINFSPPDLNLPSRSILYCNYRC
jgi:hypothetical protein